MSHTKNREARYRLPNVTTMENLSMQVSAGEGAVLKYDDHVLVTDHAWKSFIAGIYEFIETPDEIDGGECECRLNLITFPEELFADGGHAVAPAAARSTAPCRRPAASDWARFARPAG